MRVADKNYWCVKLVDLKKLEAPLIQKEVFLWIKSLQSADNMEAAVAK